MKTKLSCILIVLLLITGCAFKNLIAQNSGFFLAQEEPKLAEEILIISQKVLDANIFTKSTFQDWAGLVMNKLALDPFLQMNFKEMLKSVNINIKLAENQQEIKELTYVTIQNFMVGIKAGR